LRLYNEYRHRDAWSPMAIEGLSLEILAELSRSTAKATDAGTPRWLEQAKEILAVRLTDAPSLADLANHVGVHPVHLAREFRRRFNCTIGDFIRQLRIESACREIAQADATLCDIALRAGFYDQSHFSNTFKRFTGMTPAAYRAACRPR
jgi:AraC family transcriptional regulator